MISNSGVFSQRLNVFANTNNAIAESKDKPIFKAKEAFKMVLYSFLPLAVERYRTNPFCTRPIKPTSIKEEVAKNRTQIPNASFVK